MGMLIPYRRAAEFRAYRLIADRVKKDRVKNFNLGAYCTEWSGGSERGSPLS